ncbi:MAG TPA: ATP-binding protein [Rhodocyclaceae bacterium]|nr:ATP-binding protein [Rhodocyclaceae bacterium]
MSTLPPEFIRFLERADNVLARVESLLPPAPVPVDWRAHAFRWRKKQGRGHLEAVLHPHHIRAEDLCGIEAQLERIDQNTRQFVNGRSANNVLLTGARGTGKSSLVKAMLERYGAQGLRLIEVEKEDLVDLPDIVDLVAERSERFVIFSDDLSFESGEPGYKALKSILDGSIAGTPDNVLIYSTSNRRHLMPEYMSENLETKTVDGEIRPGETIEEKVSLSERFGLWISFYPFDQDEYLAICAHWLKEFGASAAQIEAARTDALQWSLLRGARSGRVAWQFARDYSGRINGEAAAG